MKPAEPLVVKPADQTKPEEEKKAPEVSQGEAKPAEEAKKEDAKAPAIFSGSNLFAAPSTGGLFGAAGSQPSKSLFGAQTTTEKSGGLFGAPLVAPAPTFITPPPKAVEDASKPLFGTEKPAQ